MGLFDEFRKVFGTPDQPKQRPARTAKVGRTVCISSSEKGEEINLWANPSTREIEEAMRDYRTRNTDVFGG